MLPRRPTRLGHLAAALQAAAKQGRAPTKWEQKERAQGARSSTQTARAPCCGLFPVLSVVLGAGLGARPRRAAGWGSARQPAGLRLCRLPQLLKVTVC